jgi:hypothetical protein
MISMPLGDRVLQLLPRDHSVGVLLVEVGRLQRCRVDAQPLARLE